MHPGAGVIRRAIVSAFLAHELRDLRTNARIVPLLFIFPMLGIGFPVAIALLGPAMMTEATRDPGMMAMLQAATGLREFQGLEMADALTRYVLRAVVAFYLLMPIAIASTAAAFSIVGEKQQRTLEPILATPITDREFLTGKLLVCLVPTVAVTWITAVVSVTLVDLVTLVRSGEMVLPDRFWLAGIGRPVPAARRCGDTHHDAHVGPIGRSPGHGAGVGARGGARIPGDFRGVREGADCELFRAAGGDRADADSRSLVVPEGGEDVRAGRDPYSLEIVDRRSGVAA